MIILLGDSNIEFNNHGWAAAFSRLTACNVMVGIPGGSSDDILAAALNPRVYDLAVLQARHADHLDIIVTTGINDMIQGVGPLKYVKNHIKLLEHLERLFVMWPSKRILFMPSHYTGHWKLELRRRFLQVACWLINAEFVDLSRWDDLTKYNAPDDPWHLTNMSYDALALMVAGRYGL